MIFALNTSAQETAVALIESGAVLEESRWFSQNNESQKLLPAIEAMLKTRSKTWADLTKIVVVKGPGGYTSLRVGMSIANAMAWFLKIPMVGINTFDLWKNRIPADRHNESIAIVIAAGKGQFLVEDGTFKTAKEMQHMTKTIVGELKPEYDFTLLSFGQAMIEILQKNPQQEVRINPIYTRPPHITIQKA